MNFGQNAQISGARVFYVEIYKDEARIPKMREKACMCTGKSAYHIHEPHCSHDHPPLWCAEWFAVVYYIPHLEIT